MRHPRSIEAQIIYVIKLVSYHVWMRYRGDRETINYDVIIGLFVGQVISQQQMICGQNWCTDGNINFKNIFTIYSVCTYLEPFEFSFYHIKSI